jgi:hypothetical protein
MSISIHLSFPFQKPAEDLIFIYKPGVFMQRFPILMLSVAFLSVLLTAFACTRAVYDDELFVMPDGRYDSEFPNKNGSGELADILESVKMINSIAYYIGYNFSEVSGVREISEAALSKANHVFYFNETSAGTATIIYNYGNRLALLTCEHIVTFPDTMITYYENTDRIRTVSFLRRQTNYVNGIPDGSDLEVIISHKIHDLALIGREKESNAYLPVFSYPLGEAKKLEWGSFVYLLGYPKGNKMITRGIVSSPNRNKEDHSFLVDALFNKGFSGGLILAVKDGVPNFELVGIAKSVSADYDLLITPEKHYTRNEMEMNLPYTGDLFVEERSTISYGITNTTSIESIQRFLTANRLRLEELGYDFPYFFKSVIPNNR